MNNWAIVIGIDYYPANEAWNLQGAVRDALAMREWLLKPNGGGVVFQNLKLLLSLNPDMPDSGVAFTPATSANIETAINDLLIQSQSSGDRVFLYFSGHGLSVDINLTVEQGILASDFSLKTSTRSMSVKSLFDLFQGTYFKQQFFIIDACRNIPVDRIRLGQFPHIPPPVIPPQPQFVMYATQPCVQAMQVGSPGNESGAFTSALLNGLNGKGAAKSWDNDTGEYVVRWNELFSAVYKEVQSRKLKVNFGEPLIQEPRQYGERGDENPELGRFTDLSILDEELQIDIEPSTAVLPIVCININTLSGISHTVNPPINKLPIVVSLRPKIYGINGFAAGFKPIRTKEVRLYNPEKITLEFEPNPPSTPSTNPNLLGKPYLSHLNAVLPELCTLATYPLGETASLPFNKTLRGGLEVFARESLALLQVANEAGTILKTARGRITLNDLPLGYYSLRMISPEGIAVSEKIESPNPDGIQIVELSAPSAESPAMNFLADTAGLQRATDGSISPSESIGSTFFIKLSTTLALAAAAQLEKDSGYGYKLLNIPLATFHELVGQDAESGLHLILGDEHNDGFWSTARAIEMTTEGERTFCYGMPSPLLKSFAIDGKVGSRVIRIDWGGKTTNIPCYVLPGRVTLIVITRELDGSIEVHQYMPLTCLKDISGSDDAIPNARDPHYQATNFSVIRRIEYMQRAIAHGRLSPLKPDIDLLLNNKWTDPIAGCLGAYLALRLGMTNELEIATVNLVSYFSELPDSHVLRGMYLLKMGFLKEAEYRFSKAVDIGLPIFLEGITLLRDLDKSLDMTQKFKTRIVEMSAGLVSGQPWSIKTTRMSWYDTVSDAKILPPQEQKLEQLLLLNSHRELDS